MTIRPYQPADRPSCIALFQSNVPQFFAPEELSGFENWLDGMDTGVPIYRKTKARYYDVVEENERLVACGGFYIYEDQNLASMTWGMVDRSLHRKGIGRLFLQYRLDRIKTLHPDCGVILDTTQHSYPFFEKLGFRVTKITEDAYAPGLHRYDMIADAFGK